jgi:hypothetical protein
MPSGLPSGAVRKAFGQTFDLPDGYLNTASIGVPAVAVADAVAEAVAGWRRGAGRAADFDPAVEAGRAAFADLVGVPVDRVAMVGRSRRWSGWWRPRCPTVPGCSWRRGSSPVSRSRSPRRPTGASRSSSARSTASASGRRSTTWSRSAWCSPPTDGSSTSTPCARPANRGRGWCWTRHSPSAGSRRGSPSPTPWSAPATSGCSPRAGSPGWRCTPSSTSCRTTPAGTRVTTSGAPSTASRCGWRTPPGGSTRRRRGSPTSARRRRCRGSPAWTAQRFWRTAPAWPTASVPASTCPPPAPRSWPWTVPGRPNAWPRPEWWAATAPAPVRLAFYLYNTTDDVARVLDALM